MTSETTARIVNRYQESQSEPFRAHLGGSVIGRKCSRELWYSFRFCTNYRFPGRLMRLFDTGQREEQRFVSDLRSVGIDVIEVDPATGKQFTVNAHGNHFGGSFDGVGRNFPESPESWMLIEMKTHNDKSFNELKAKGVKEAKPEHYAQMQIYMHLSNGLKKAFYIAVNKNTDELYSEIVDYDESYGKQLLNRASNIIFAEQPPERISSDPAWFECKLCVHRKVCHGVNLPYPNCRNCVKSTCNKSGGWLCDNLKISFINQVEGCESHIYLPFLVSPMANVIDSTDESIIYENSDGGNFSNGWGGYTSAEMYAVSLESQSLIVLGDEQFKKLRKDLNATVVKGNI